MTIIVTFSSYSIALVIGLILGLFRLPPDQGSTWYIKGIRGVLYHLSTLYVELIRGIPLLVLLFAFAFVITPELTRLEGVVGDIFRWFFGRLDDVEVQILGINGQLSEAVLGLAVGYGAYLAEVFRAGIQSVSKGQMEAARSLGMSYSQSMRHVVLPQAIRVVLPPLGNDFIAILKDTSLISALALPELFLRGRGYASASYRILQVYTAMALFYVVTTLLLSLLVRQIERWSRLP